MFLLNFGHHFEENGDFGEAFLASGLGHTGVHISPFIVLAIGGILQIGLGVGHFAIMEELEPNLGMFLLVTSRFLEEVGNLVVAFFTGF